MADLKISQLPNLSIAGGGNLLAIVDTAGFNVTKHILVQDLMGSPGQIGGTNPNTGEFTTIVLSTGSTIGEFSIDGTLAGDSDVAVPTEKAVKTYVDAQIGATEHNELGGLQGGLDSTEFYHLDVQLYNQLSSTPTSVLLSNGLDVEGDVGIDGILSVDSIDSTALVVSGDIHCDDLFTSGSTIHLGNVTLTADTNGLKVNKLKLQSGVQVDEISTDTALGSSDIKVPTQRAVKTYVDTQIGLGIETGNYNMSTGDTTAEIVFVQEQGSSNYSIGYSIINTVDNPPLLFVSGVFEKTVDGFKVMFSSPMDTDNYVVSWIVTDAQLGSSSSSSRSSSSTSSSLSAAGGELLFIDVDDQDEDYENVWSDGTYIYVANGGAGLRSYSVDGSGILTYIDTHDQGGDYKGVWGDGTFVYAVDGLNFGNGLISYSVDGAGNLTYKDNDFQGSDGYRGVWGDGNFIYVACMDNGLRSYSVDGAGVLTHIDTDYQGGDYYKVWGDGTYIYTVCDLDGIRTYSVDGGGNLTYIDTDHQGSSGYLDVWGDGNYIYVATYSEGIRSYSVDGSGILTYIDVDNQGGNYYGVWGDGTYIYTACRFDGIRSYSVDGSGNLTFLDVDDQGATGYLDVWGDGTYIYTACDTDGLRSYSVS